MDESKKANLRPEASVLNLNPILIRKRIKEEAKKFASKAKNPQDWGSLESLRRDINFLGDQHNQVRFGFAEFDKRIEELESRIKVLSGMLLKIIESKGIPPTTPAPPS